jgi:succinate dehydrogenase/fumarate reductase flavoprotein subunit
METKYDYIIIGAGAAGCVAAIACQQMENIARINFRGWW